MLTQFIDSLSTRFPEARLDMARSAHAATDAQDRIESLCQHYSEILDCEADLAAQEAYLAYINQFSDALGVEPDKAKESFETGIGVAGFAGISALALLLTENATHAADGGSSLADAAAHGMDLVDLGELVATLGVSLLLSFGVGRYFRNRNRQKQEELACATEQAYLNGRLAKALMTRNGNGAAEDVLRRMREIESGATDAGGT